MGAALPRAAESGSAARSVSSAGTEAAAPCRGVGAAGASAGGPGEYRHLTRGGRQYATGSAGQEKGPAGAAHLPGLPRGERGVWGTAPRF